MDYINSHTTSHSTNFNLILSPDPEQSPAKGGGRNTCVDYKRLIKYINSHTTSHSTNFNLILSPDPEQSPAKGGGVGTHVWIILTLILPHTQPTLT